MEILLDTLYRLVPTSAVPNVQPMVLGRNAYEGLAGVLPGILLEAVL